jgi:uncharacterized membrane-anchored protein YhcB (DUF1043 family)
MNIRPLGMLLLVLGFFGASFVAVWQSDTPTGGGKNREWGSIHWPAYGAALAVGIVGVVILRRTATQAVSAEKATASLRTLDESLNRLLANVRAIRGESAQLDVYAVAPRIEQDLNEDIARFVDARETLIPLFGLQAYANIMNHFAAAERTINRAWCASADGYVDEVWACFERVEELLDATRQELNLHQQTLDRTAAAGVA